MHKGTSIYPTQTTNIQKQGICLSFTCALWLILLVFLFFLFLFFLPLLLLRTKVEELIRTATNWATGRQRSLLQGVFKQCLLLLLCYLLLLLLLLSLLGLLNEKLLLRLEQSGFKCNLQCQHAVGSSAHTEPTQIAMHSGASAMKMMNEKGR